MNCLILCAGRSTRMMPLTATRPKPLLFVGGKPLLQHIIENLRDAGIKNISILVGYLKQNIIDFFGDGRKFGVNIKYIEQATQSGTADAISLYDSVDDFLCLNGDIIFDKKIIIDLLKFYKKHKTNIITGIKLSDCNPEKYGMLKIDADKNILDIVEKSKSSIENWFVNSGIYIFTPAIFDEIKKTKVSERKEYEITTTIKQLIDKKEILCFTSTEKWFDIGRPWDLLDANEYCLQNINTELNGKIEKNVIIHGNVFVGEHSILRSGTYILGNVYIGKNCDIGPNCFIRGSTCIGNNCRVGNAVEIKNSIVMDSTHIPHHNYIGDSIIGEHCNFGAGTKIANLRFDDKNIDSYVKGK